VLSAGAAAPADSFLRLVPRWLGDLEVRQYTPATRATYAASLGLFVAWCQEREVPRASQVTRAVLEAYQRHLFGLRSGRGRGTRAAAVAARTTGGAGGDSGLPLSVASQRSRVRPVMRFYAWAVRKGHLGANPAADLDLPRGGQPLPEVLTPDEVAAVFAACDVRTPVGVRDRAFIELLYATGLRRMEALRLHLDHVDPVRGVVQVIEGKGRKDRFVPTGQRALAWLSSYLVIRGRWCRDGLVRELFLAEDGQPLTPTAIGLRVHRLLERAGIAKRGACHLFRHAFATHLLERGCELRLIASFLGHASVATTTVYTHTALTTLLHAHAVFHPLAGVEAGKADAQAGDSPVGEGG
jgi:integrase/recombinase XerD